MNDEGEWVDVADGDKKDKKKRNDDNEEEIQDWSILDREPLVGGSLRDTLQHIRRRGNDRDDEMISKRDVNDVLSWLKKQIFYF